MMPSLFDIFVFDGNGISLKMTVSDAAIKRRS